MAANYFSELENAYSLLNIEDDIDDELFSEFDLDEVNLPDSFSCSICNKILKTKRGIERHEENHRLKNSIEILDINCWHVLLKSAVEKVIDEDIQSDEVLEELKTFNGDCKDNNCLQPFIPTLSFVYDLQKFYPMFYKVVTQLSSLHGLGKESTIVLGFELAHHVLGHYKKPNETSVSSTSSIVLSNRQVAIVTYISGYVVSELFRRLRKSPNWQTELLSQKLGLLKAGKEDGNAVKDDPRYDLVRCRDRGGLWYVKHEMISIFVETEKEYARKTQGFFTKIPYELIVKAVVKMDVVQSSIKNLESLSLCDIPFKDESLNNFLYDMVLLYVRVRAHSTAKDIVAKHKLTSKSSGKALRAELKRSSPAE